MAHIRGMAGHKQICIQARTRPLNQGLVTPFDRLQLYLHFDPVTLATQTVEEHLYHKYTAPLPYEDFRKLHPTILQRHVGGHSAGVVAVFQEHGELLLHGKCPTVTLPIMRAANPGPQP